MRRLPAPLPEDDPADGSDMPIAGPDRLSWTRSPIWARPDAADLGPADPCDDDDADGEGMDWSGWPAYPPSRFPINTN